MRAEGMRYLDWNLSIIELHLIPFNNSYKKILVSETVIKNTFFLDSGQFFIERFTSILKRKNAG